MEIIPFTFNEVLAACRKIDPCQYNENKWSACHYSYIVDGEPTKPACVAGAIVHALDADVFALLAPLECSFSSLHDPERLGQYAFVGKFFTDETVAFLNDVQVEADSGYPWGAALAWVAAQHNIPLNDVVRRGFK